MRPLADVVCEKQPHHCVEHDQHDQEGLSCARNEGGGDYNCDCHHARRRKEESASGADLEMEKKHCNGVGGGQMSFSCVRISVGTASTSFLCQAAAIRREGGKSRVWGC